MKKLIIPLLVIILFSACGGGVDSENEDQGQTQSQEDVNAETIALWEVNEDGCLTKINVAYDDKSDGSTCYKFDYEYVSDGIC